MPVTTDEIIARLDVYSKRLRASIVQALCLNTIFQSLNEAEEWREAIGRGPASTAANILQHAVLRELILILVRVFDRPPGKVEKSDKVSFPVLSIWLERDDIREALALKARTWFVDGYRADENEASVRDAIQRLKDGLDRLAIENPNRNANRNSARCRRSSRRSATTGR